MTMNGDTPTAIEAHAVSFSVEAKTLLDRVDVRAGRGQFVGLIGPNGSGKSTLLRALSGIIRHDEGAVWLEGSDLASMAARGETEDEVVGFNWDVRWFAS